MKKVFFTIALLAVTMFASAQHFYVGGSFGIDYSKNKTKHLNETTENYKTFSWDITPSVGFMFAENMGVGLDLGFGMTNTTYPKTNTDPERKVKSTSWTVAPYFRYVTPFVVEHFSFYADFKVNLTGSSYSVGPDHGPHHLNPDNPDGESYCDGDKSFNWGVALVPGMAYSFNEHVSMNCALNILSLGFQQEKFTTKDGEDDKVSTTTKFGLGVNRATPITIGFFYTF